MSASPRASEPPSSGRAVPRQLAAELEPSRLELPQAPQVSLQRLKAERGVPEVLALPEIAC